jgi:UDP-N-acetylglucosamine--N-acetylmuramyl-(pentapeptide) pyrophosphoryl-undecaprenol N-acetylglucosamine transferase
LRATSPRSWKTPHKAETMARAALGEGKPDATARLVALVEAFGGEA